MNETIKDQSRSIFRELEQKLNEALQSGDPRQVDNIIQSTAYALGAAIPKVVEPGSIGPMTKRTIEFIVSGIQQSITNEGIQGHFEAIVIGKRL